MKDSLVCTSPSVQIRDLELSVFDQCGVFLRECPEHSLAHGVLQICCQLLGLHPDVPQRYLSLTQTLAGIYSKDGQWQCTKVWLKSPPMADLRAHMCTPTP